MKKVMSKALIGLIVAVLLPLLFACRSAYVPVIATPLPTPQPTPPPFEPSEYTVGIYGAPEEVSAGFLARAQALSYNAEIVEGDMEEALVWAKTHDALLFYGMGETARTEINEAASSGCIAATAFFEGAAPVGSAFDLSFARGSAGAETARVLAEMLSGKQGAVLVCEGEGTAEEQLADKAFRSTWQTLLGEFELSGLELLPTEYTGDEPDAAKAVMQRRGDIAGVFAASASAACAWAKAASEIEQPPVIACSSFSEEALAVLLEGKLLCVYSFPYNDLGTLAAENFDILLRGEGAVKSDVLNGELLKAS